MYKFLGIFVFQDSFGRMNERSKEVPKTMKQLSKLFPNKIVIQPPQVSFYILYISNMAKSF